MHMMLAMQLTTVVVLLQIIVNEVAKETYLVYQCGCWNRTRPFPANLAPAGAKVFEGPLQSISADDTSVGEFMVSLLLHAITQSNACRMLLTQQRCFVSCWFTCCAV
jgi:hypothetical protein